MKGLVVAGTNSGVGKTTISLALMAALKRKGYVVQAFKVGPDFIDPGYHALATGRPPQNLDGWMLSESENRNIFSQSSKGADVVVVEGVMGFYDGYDGQSEAGSTAQMAKWLGLPVLLTINAKAMARSIAALAKGFIEFDPGVTWAGVLANRIGSPTHLEYLADALKLLPGIQFLGGLTRDDDLAIPERHLGLVTAGEGTTTAESFDRLADWFENGVKLDALLDSLPDIKLPETSAGLTPAVSREKEVRIGIARDKAFCFYYEENLRRLEEAGACLVFFSPLECEQLPPGLDGLYLGGGYPEVFARDLSANPGMMRSVKEAGLGGMPVYAECGGLMYLADSMMDHDGNRFAMAGLLPLEVRMLDKLKSLGYREVRFNEDGIFGKAGAMARGHEFHYSEIGAILESPGLNQKALSVSNRKGLDQKTQGFLFKNILASYIHLHFGSNPELAPNFVNFCKRNR